MFEAGDLVVDRYGDFRLAAAEEARLLTANDRKAYTQCGDCGTQVTDPAVLHKLNRVPDEGAVELLLESP